MDKLKICVIFGGCSPEYPVSLQSAAGLIDSMDREKFEPILLGITKEGKWLYYEGDTEGMRLDTWWLNNAVSATLSPDMGSRELLVLENEVRHIKLDAVFPVLHGENGEDGSVQGLCQLSGIPLIGCKTLSSALCMDKIRAHELVSLQNVATPKAFVFDAPLDFEKLSKKAEELGYPLFVKPVRAGSSFGISKVQDGNHLKDAVIEALKFDSRVILEENIEGVEIGCAVMGRNELITGELDEIELSKGFFDYGEKYTLKSSKIHVPARITQEKAAEIKETAKIIYKTLDCDDFARVDMFLRPDGKIYFNEVNTIPGLTPHSRFPGMMKAAGFEMKDLVSKIILDSLKG